MSRSELLALLKETAASPETLWHVMHVWREPVKSRTLEEIIDFACQACFITNEQFHSRCRKRPIVIARYLFYFFGKKELGYNLTELGDKLSQDHTTVIHAIQTVKDLTKIKDPQFIFYKRNFENILNARPPYPIEVIESSSNLKPKRKRRARLIKFYYDRSTGIHYRTIADISADYNLYYGYHSNTHIQPMSFYQPDSR